MPNYDYYCESNNRTIEVSHPADHSLRTWGELCYVAHIPLGDTDVSAPVRRRIRAPWVHVPVSNSRLKEHGFTKLVRRDDGVYENVTALDGELRYMEAGKEESLPHLHKKVGD